MRLPSLLLAAAVGISSSWAQSTPCDLNNDGVVNVVDVQLAVNMALGATPCTVGSCDASLPILVQTASLTGVCHNVVLNWVASITPGVTYNVYRSSTSGGPYTRLNSSGPSLTYTDIISPAPAGYTVYYYYVVRAFNGSVESANSNEAQVLAPSP